MKNPDLKLDLNSIQTQLKHTGSFFERYSVILFIVVVVGLYGYLILQISNAATREPTQAQVSEEIGAVKTLNIDENSIAKIQQLEDQNIEVQSLFQDARDNPFSE